jgi:serine/threonine protein kinase
MNVGDEVNGYRIMTAPTNAGGGMSQWSFAEREGRQYFVKMFLAPKFPLDSGPGSPAAKARKRAACLAFEERHLEIQNRLDPNAPGGGNLVVTRDFFRVESTYVKVMDRVDAASLPSAADLTPHQIMVILRTLVFSLRLLHDKHVVHGDIKPDNILVQKGGGELLISKLIDFDEAYIAGQPPPSEQIVGDPGYYSPELLQYIKKADDIPATSLGLASDMFSLGVFLHNFLSLGAPLFDRSKANYPAEAVLSGIPLDVGTAPVAIQPLVSSLLASRPADRPTIDDVIRFLEDVDQNQLAPRRTAATPLGPDRVSVPSAKLTDPATTRASGRWPARVTPTVTPSPVGPTAAPVEADRPPPPPPPPESATSPAGTVGATPTSPTPADPPPDAGELRISMGRRKRPGPS